MSTTETNVIVRAAGAVSVADMIAKIKIPDDAVRGPAWQSAGQFGAEAVKPLTAVMSDANFETARCAKRALWKIVHTSGRPGNKKGVRALDRELISVLPDSPAPVQREIVWMLSEIGGDDAVKPIAVLLEEAEVRDDARCALTRLPGKKSLAALQSALATAPEEFKFALAESLRARGVKVDGYPSRKMIPKENTDNAK
jgi:HEAT repeat protein